MLGVGLGRKASIDSFIGVQVRIFAPSLGWFKGTLIKSPFVDKVQLPESMQKVNKSKVNHNDMKDDAFVIIKACFPNETAIDFAKVINGEKVVKVINGQRKEETVSGKWKDSKWKDSLAMDVRHLLAMNGVPHDLLDEYVGLYKENPMERKDFAGVSGKNFEFPIISYSFDFSKLHHHIICIHSSLGW